MKRPLPFISSSKNPVKTNSASIAAVGKKYFSFEIIGRSFLFLSFVLTTCLLLQTLTTSAASGCKSSPVYCTPSGKTNIFGNGYVTEFKITDSLNNVLIDQTAAASASCCNYIDNTGVGTPNLVPGSTYTISGSRQDDGIGDPFSYGMNIWIDYNDDGTFDNTGTNVEIVYKEGLSDVDAYSFSYTIPSSGITAGVHRLRIRTHYSDANPDPCANLTSGAQGMDFLVNIVCSTPSTVAAGNDSSVCAGATINLISNETSGNTPFSYSWCGPNGFTSAQQNPSLTNIVLADSGTYIVTLTDGAGCTSSAAVAIVISPSPLESASNSSPICSGGVLYLSTGGGTSYSWTGPNNFTSSQQYPIITNIAGADSGVYSVVITATGGCTASASTSVIVTQSSSATASGSAPLCAGDTLNLFSGGGTGYSWAGPNSFSSSAQNPVITNAAEADSGTYTVTVTGGGGCTSTASATVTIKQSPSASASGNSPVCSGGALNLQSGGGTNYSWTGPNGFSSLQQNPGIVHVAIADSGTYTVIVTGSNGCTTSASASVSVGALPTPSDSSSGSSVCYGNALYLYSDGGVNYSWTGPNSFSSSDQNPVIANAVTGDSGTYTVTVTGSNGCSATTSLNINIYAPVITPVVIQSGDSLICEDTTFASYQWYLDIALIVGATHPVLIVTQSGNYNIQVTDANGCSVAVGINVTFTGIPVESEQEAESIFPNPVSNEMNIHSSLLTGNGNTYITIINMLGETVWEEQTKPSVQHLVDESGYTINIGDLKAGIYFLQMKSGDGNVVKRFVKE